MNILTHKMGFTQLFIFVRIGLFLTATLCENQHIFFFCTNGRSLPCSAHAHSRNIPTLHFRTSCRLVHSYCSKENKIIH
jgi:hypothetical protein